MNTTMLFTIVLLTLIRLIVPIVLLVLAGNFFNRQQKHAR